MYIYDEIDELKATKGLKPGMDPELSYNAEGYYDPTAGVALSRIMREEQNKEAWKRIAVLESKKRKQAA